MTPSEPDRLILEPAQRMAAKIVGILYLVTMATAVFSQSYVRGRLVVRGDAEETATNILASERLFRVGVASDLLTFAGVVMLVWALYVVLSPVGRNLALLGVFWRLVECSVGSAVALNSLVTLRLLSGVDYLQVMETPHLQALARLFVGQHGAGLGVAFVFLGLGSTVFAYLWLRSGYIPRAIAVWGIFSSLLLSVGSLCVMVFPGLWGAVGMAYMMPMGLYEIGLGLWLLVKGLREPHQAL